MDFKKLTQSKPVKPPADPYQVFTHGRRFMAAEEYLRRKGPDEEQELLRVGWIALPSNVLSAFASELFLKSLLILDGNPSLDVHNLGTLYKRLHNKKKDRLSAIWDETKEERERYLPSVETTTGAKLPRDLRGALKECGDAFTMIRYHYEDPSRSKFYLSELPRILHRYILEIKPEWE